MAQLVEQRIRNACVAGSSPASGSRSWYLLGTSFFVFAANQKAIVCTQNESSLLASFLIDFA